MSTVHCPSQIFNTVSWEAQNAAFYANVDTYHALREERAWRAAQAARYASGSFLHLYNVAPPREVVQAAWDARRARRAEYRAFDILEADAQLQAARNDWDGTSRTTYLALRRAVKLLRQDSQTRDTRTLRHLIRAAWQLRVLMRLDAQEPKITVNGTPMSLREFRAKAEHITLGTDNYGIGEQSYYVIDGERNWAGGHDFHGWEG